MAEIDIKINIGSMMIGINRRMNYKVKRGIVIYQELKRCAWVHVKGFYLTFHEKSDGTIIKDYMRDNYLDHDQYKIEYDGDIQSGPLSKEHASMIKILMRAESDDAARVVLGDDTPLRKLVDLLITGVLWVSIPY